MEKKCFYLKINRMEGYTIRNLRRWLNIVRQYGADCFIQCDHLTLMERVMDDCSDILNELKASGYRCEFIESNRDNAELVEIVNNISDDFWRKAAFAHLTTFLDSKEQGYDYFWNIDADDTRIMLNAERSCEFLKRAEKKMIELGFSILSLDMWASRAGDGFWSFGVTYIDNSMDWIDLMFEYARSFPTDAVYNIDKFFRYMKNNKCIKMGTFYGENLKFIHYSNDFLWRAWESGVYHWKGGRLYMPILLNEFGLSSAGDIKIIDEAIKIDMDILDSESMEEFIGGCKNPEFFSEAPGRI